MFAAAIVTGRRNHGRGRDEQIRLGECESVASPNEQELLFRLAVSL
jgi:hypothetical protein